MQENQRPSPQRLKRELEMSRAWVDKALLALAAGNPQLARQALDKSLAHSLLASEEALRLHPDGDA